MESKLFFGQESVVEKIETLGVGKWAFVDEHVYAKHQNKLLKYQFKNIFIIPSGESSKSWDTVHQMIDFLMEEEVGRFDFIIGIGGGVVTDLTGFVASIYKRGVPFAFIPTTILAMVDASIGGKNGINLTAAKNQIGTINFPQFIAYDFEFLNSLPEVEWKNGFAEIIKHAFISSVELYYILKQHDLSYFKNNEQALQSLIHLAAKIKLDVVEEDPNEQGKRMILNYGHTLGHAFEKVENIAHGHAVMKGMYWEQKLAEETYPFSSKINILATLTDLMEKYYPVPLDWPAAESLISYLKQDKKRLDQYIKMPFVFKLGNAEIKEVSLKTMENFIYEYSNSTK